MLVSFAVNGKKKVSSLSPGGFVKVKEGMLFQSYIVGYRQGKLHRSITHVLT
jgi:hypothetical protein